MPDLVFKLYNMIGITFDLISESKKANFEHKNNKIVEQVKSTGKKKWLNYLIDSMREMKSTNL